MSPNPGAIQWQAALAAALALAPVAAGARERPPVPFPAFDIPASCQEEIDRVACADVEASERDLLAVRWPQLPPDLQRQCVVAGRRQRGSYSAARGCAERGQALPPLENH